MLRRHDSLSGLMDRTGHHVAGTSQCADTLHDAKRLSYVSGGIDSRNLKDIKGLSHLET